VGSYPHFKFQTMCRCNQSDKRKESKMSIDPTKSMNQLVNISLVIGFAIGLSVGLILGSSINV